MARAKANPAPEADQAHAQVDEPLAGAGGAESGLAGAPINAAPAARSSLLLDLEAIMREAEGVDHVRHEAIGALVSRLSALKHHLARTESLDVAVLHPSLATIADLL